MNASSQATPEIEQEGGVYPWLSARMPDELVRETAEFFVAEGYMPSDLPLFCPDVPGRSQVMAMMATPDRLREYDEALEEQAARRGLVR